MPESAEDVYARVVAAVGEGGRLPMPPVSEWDIFPWEVVEGELRPKVVGPPLAAEEPRRGEGPDKPCHCTQGEPANAVWRNERWVVTSMEKPSGLPLLLFLHPREHLDFSDLSDEMAAEFGVLTNRLHRIMVNLANIGRVHVCKWGDGGAHLHVWFIARTERLPGIIGSPAVEWDEILPDVPIEIWRADVKAVAERLSHHDGRALV